MMDHWKPGLGAWVEAGEVNFHVWAPDAHHVEVVVRQAASSETVLPLHQLPGGYFGGKFATLQAGDRYRYRVDGRDPFPDPASRYQPEGIHGPSEVVNSGKFPWTDSDWRGISLQDAIIYELHVGTFSESGTFSGVMKLLPRLVELGVTAIELMPVADFPGDRNWGYDGVNLFAPARCYGRPDDLRQLVNEAHRLQLAVILDVVYNHLGPDGNYLRTFSPYYFSKRHHNAWGEGLNFDGAHSQAVRDYFIENALHWIHEYHIDGLRLDATHAIIDEGPRHFLDELQERVRATLRERQVLLIAEDHRNLAQMIKSPLEGGWGLDAVWADDFHHQVRRMLAGDNEGYFADFAGTIADLVETIRNGWFYCGQYSNHLQEHRGTDSSSLNPNCFVVCIQNHDQVGNRALGERLHHQIDLAAYRAASTLLLCCPQTPLLFMGQEWAASSPFLFFTDHNTELGRLVTQGRRQEFRHFSAFADPAVAERIPDPQAPATFDASRLRWQEQDLEPHASVLRLYQSLLHFRRTEPALGGAGRQDFQVHALNENALALLRCADESPRVLVLVQLRDSGTVDLRGYSFLCEREPCGWEVVFTTEDEAFAPDPQPAQIDLTSNQPVLQFKRAGAVVLRERLESSS
jgi:maltooligosyltrehalose trehalohydrolase